MKLAERINMINQQDPSARVEAAGDDKTVTTVQSPRNPPSITPQSPNSEPVTIDQSAADGVVTINQCDSGLDSDCDDRPVAGDPTVAESQSTDAHSMISPFDGATEASPPADMLEKDSSTPVDGADVTPPGAAGGRKKRAKETRRRRGKGLGGLQLEKTGIWTVRCLINGKRVSKSTGTRDRAEAEQFAKRFLAPYVKDDAARTFENIQAAVMTERQLAAMREAEGPQLKLVDAWEGYEKSPMRRDLAPTTMEGKRQVCRQFVEYMAKVFPEVVEVRHVTRYHAENYLNYLRRGTSASTYNNRLCVLREVHRTIMERAAAKSNPWEGFPLRADDSHTRRELTVEELARLVDVASREGHEWRTLFGIAMYTGMRLGDCCKLTWAEVDIVRSVIQKVPEKTKKYRKGRPVTIPIHKVLADLLMQTPVAKRSGYVLPTVGAWAASGTSGMGRVQHRVGRIFKNAGIVMSVEVKGRSHKAPEATFHSLRHTFVSMSANAGVPLHIVQAIVGHESTAMTRHYYHENVAALQKAVEAIPSISETGDVSEGGVAPPDIGRLRPAYAPQAAAAAFKLPSPPQPASVQPPPQVSGNADAANGGQETVEVVEPATVIGADGVERANPHVEAPLAGRSAERNAIRREDKLAAVEAANADAAGLGGWGGASDPAPVPSAADRRLRNQWIGRCVRRWCQQKKTALLEGTSRLVANGGYRFLQELWGRGVPITLEDAVDALDVFLNAKEE